MQDVHVQKVIERCFCLKLMNKSCGESDLGFFVKLYGQLLGVITQVPSSRILKKKAL